jgi:hypothetical protein
MEIVDSLSNLFEHLKIGGLIVTVEGSKESSFCRIGRS